MPLKKIYPLHLIIQEVYAVVMSNFTNFHKFQLVFNLN